MSKTPQQTLRHFATYWQHNLVNRSTKHTWVKPRGKRMPKHRTHRPGVLLSALQHVRYKTTSTPFPEPCPMMLATLSATITVKHLVGQPVAAMIRYVAQGIAWTSELTTCCLSTIQK